MDPLFTKIYRIGLVPVIRIDDVDTALPLVEALKEGGLPCAEITFRTRHAAEAIRRIAARFPEILLGAGTVLTPQQVIEAKQAGAAFIVTPGFNPRVVDKCLEEGIPVIPGCSSTSDMEQAMERGLRVVKFFPAEASGGLAYLKAVSAPYRDLSFIPTGGISEKNVGEYLAFPKILACGGSWMVPSELINASKYDEIRAIVTRSVQQVLGFELKHIGINAGNAESASALSATFATSFGIPAERDSLAGVFAGSIIEIMKSQGRGEHGHIALGTANVDRAKDFLERKGLRFLPETEQYLPDGRLRFVYVDGEFGGFAIHLVLK